MSQRDYRFPSWPSEEPYFRCLTEESYQSLAVAKFAAYAGELPSQSESCIREIAGEGFQIARPVDDRYLLRELIHIFETAAQELCLAEAEFNAIYPPLPGEAIELPPNYFDCVRSIYNETVAKLRGEDGESVWANGESTALDAFWDGIEGCTTQP